MSRIASSLLVAALVVFAGCAGGIGGLNDSQASDSGTVAFYVSDERNAIDQFSHLNVTVTKVAFAGDADANATANATAAANASSGANATTAEEDAGADGDAEASGDADAEADSDAGLVVRDVEDRTVDLTALQGENATLLGNISVPEGEYEKVFVHVGEVNATLQNGESANVKLPSEKLHVNKNFEASSTSNVDFVFDITVFEAGNSGQFILKPVASESGTDVEIDVVGGPGAAANAAANADADAELDVHVLGNATAGENATVKVTQQGEAVTDAALRAGDEVVATTNANGTAEVRVPADGELELEATANAGGDGEESLLEGELELELGAEADGDGSGDADGGENDGADGGESGDADGDADSSASADLAVALDGSLTADEQATVVVTDGDGDAVENATVAVDGTVVGETNADGELTFDVPVNVSMDSTMTVTADGEQVTLTAGTVAAAN